MRYLKRLAALLICLSGFASAAHGEYMMTEISRLYQVWEVSYDVAMTGDHVFVANGEQGVAVLDASDMTWLVEVGGFNTPGYASGLAINEDEQLLFVADGSSGLRIYDISDPTTPALEAAMTLPGHNLSVRLHNDFAYVGYGNDGTGGGVRVLDVSDSDDPSIVGSIGLDGPVHDIALLFPTLYAAAGEGGLAIVGMQNPSQPQLFGSMTNFWEARGVAVHDDFAYVTDTAGWLSVIDVSDQNDPFQTGSLTTLSGLTTIELVERGPSLIAYTADMHAFRVLDVTNPLSPNEIGSSPIAGDDENGRSLAFLNNTVMLANGSYGMLSFDVSDDAAPMQLGSFSGMRAVNGVTFHNEHVYLLDGKDGLRVIDLHDEEDPVEVGGGAFQMNRFTISGSHGYGVGTSLHTFDVIDPANPIELGSLTLPENARDVHVQGSIAYVACGVTGLVVVDISDRYAPELIGSAALPGLLEADAVDFANNRVVVASEAGGLYLYEVSDPASPTLIDEVDDLSNPHDLLGDESFLYVAWGDGSSGGLAIYIVTAQGALVQLSLLDQGVPSYGVAVTHEFEPNVRFALLAQQDGGLTAVNIGNQQAPFVDGQTSTAGNSRAVAAWEELIFVANEQHLSVFSGSTTWTSAPQRTAAVPGQHALGPVYPNPFNSSARTSFDLPRSGRVTLALFDLLGRRVATLSDRVFDAGRHEVRIDGSGLASGTYLLRATAAEGWNETRRLTLLR